MAYERADGLRYLFIDFNAFFAAVEQHDDRALRGRPVMVIPLASEHTSAIAVSYEARAFGVKRGTKVRDARALCPGIAIRPARHDRYVAIHNDIMATLQEFLPLAKVYSIDEAAFRLGRRESEPGPALEIARRMRDGLAARFFRAARVHRRCADPAAGEARRGVEKAGWADRPAPARPSGKAGRNDAHGYTGRRCQSLRALRAATFMNFPPFGTLNPKERGAFGAPCRENASGTRFTDMKSMSPRRKNQ